MDFISWLSLAVLGGLLFGSWAWGRARSGRRAAGARRWAARAGLSELPATQEGVPGDRVVRRARDVPSFVGALDGRQVSVVAMRSAPRFGSLWALCTHAPGLAPLFAGSVVDFSFARVLGAGQPHGWVPVKLGAPLDERFFFSVPDASVQPTLSAAAQTVLLDTDVFAFSFSSAGFVVLFFRQGHGVDSEAALDAAARALKQLLA